ncbi:hypothetical protein BVRB_031280 [Beta vulgaris subsp. vulgaris]|uniref:MSP domain-containing protein n=1 Tax=Beta vulgaris subsp. vulgaris TaxID=3555 RepID=A0A0J8B0K9_BETVV|nr:hypothetical protein BVRB_031280 [Beta vulgaris subsp. vulgaris]
MTGRGLDPTGQQHNHLLSIEPEEVVFTSVRLNQVYTQCVRINNPLSCPVDIELVSGNNERVTVNPNSLRLKSQEEMLVEIRLLLRKPVSRMTGRAQDKATDRAYREV